MAWHGVSLPSKTAAHFGQVGQAYFKMAYRCILQEVASRERVNDENLQPANTQDRPTDHDRARFGFKPRSLPTKLEEKAKKDEASPEEVDLQGLLRRTIGDPDDVLPVLRLKPTAGKYDFKDKIADLQAMINPLKNAVSDQRLKARALIEALLGTERGINDQLRESAQEAASLRHDVTEVNDRLHSTQQELTALRAEHSRLKNNAEGAKRREVSLAEQLKEASSQAAKLQKDLEEQRKAAQAHSEDAARYKRKCEELGDRHRAQMEEAAELLRRQVNDTMQAQEQLVEAHRKKEAVLIADFEKAKDGLKQEHRRQMAGLEKTIEKKEAAGKADLHELRKSHQQAMNDKELMLKAAISQMEDLTKTHQAAVKDKDLAHRQKEEMMSAKLEQLEQAHQAELKQKECEMTCRMEDLTKKHQAAMQDKDLALRQKDEKLSAKMEQLEQAHQAELDQKERQLTESIKSLRMTHDTATRELESAHRQQEAELREFIDSLGQTHKKVLEERMRAHEEKEAAQKDAIGLLHQQIADKGSEMRNCLEKLRHQQKLLEESETSHRIKEEAAQTAMESLQQKLAEKEIEMENRERVQQAVLQDKEAFFRQQDGSLREMIESLRRQLAEKEANLRDTFQSMQLLQNTAGEQLRLEQQRVHKLEAEVKDLRDQLDELRSSSLAGSHRADMAESELASSRQLVQELRQAVQRLEGEKDQQFEKASERQAALQEEIVHLRTRFGGLQQEFGILQASADARQAQCEKLTQQRDSLEVEFRSYKDHHGTSNQQQMEAITELRLTVDKLSKQVDFTKAELQVQKGNVSQHQGYIISLENQLARSECTRRELHNMIQELKGNIRVFCRIRPRLLETSETPSMQASENKIALDYMNESYSFGFDRVFETTSTQEAVFDEVGGLVQSALDGYKVCIFAYGQTGSGKTFTMQGTPECGASGLIPRCLSKILQSSEAMRATGWDWKLKVSFLEVYNEVLRDLLDDSSSMVHVIKHDDAYGTMVTNLTAVEVSRMDHINRLMEKAARARAVGATDMNATSSRSHSVFALYLHGVNRELDCELQGALHLVDLAGSERLDKSGSTGDRLKETQNINKSLSSLADVFLAKAEGRAHIPFRNSKLTHLMEPCLNGQGKTLMVVNVGPEMEHAHETLCSLRFASQVSQCNTGGKPKRCVRPVTGPKATGRQPVNSRRAK
ncbi:unnamed protein product [Effrenium voratum]|nr:unnamed protein product [Effrenium voratum]